MYEAMMLRKVATLAGVVTPESEEALIFNSGSILSKVSLVLEKLFENNQQLRATLKEVSGCCVEHNTPKLCEGCLISINRALTGIE